MRQCLMSVPLSSALVASPMSPPGPRTHTHLFIGDEFHALCPALDIPELHLALAPALSEVFASAAAMCVLSLSFDFPLLLISLNSFGCFTGAVRAFFDLEPRRASSLEPRCWCCAW
ncbi:hypothetical protein B0H12DRAFT_1160078 [Mycena haematopus]|nr:hypothetical protein B0H12DRAFT_1160078 [Mycena haematopus]